MSQWIVPSWNHHHHQSHQSQQQQEDANRSSSSSHVHYFSHKNSTLFSHNLLPMPEFEGIERRWESGDQQEAAAIDGHGHGEVLLQMPSTKHSWSQSEDTLESIVHSSLSRKRTRSNPEYCKDETLMTEASLESHRNFKTKHSIQDLAPNHDGSEEERKTNGRSCSIRQTRTTIINHNQFERRQRDRINQKMKDLQKLVPNGSKTDRASLLDDTIQYLKQLQAQVQFMGSIRSALPQMVMPLGIQQQHQLQMSLLDAASMASSSSYFPCAAFPPILLPSIISTTKPKCKLSTGAFVLPTDPFCTFLAQSMDMDFYSKMVTLYCQEVNRTPRQTNKLMQSQSIEGIKEDMHQS